MTEMHDGQIIPPGGISGVEVIRQAASNMPMSAGVYRMLDAEGKILYVGKARALKNRVLSYLNLPQLSLRIQRMVMATCALETTLCASEAEALLLEANMIKMLQPRYNILLRDDKSYPYIRIDSDHAFPRIGKYRGTKDAPGDYFGPFPSAGAVDETVTLLQKVFLLRPCSDNVFKNRTRPCLQYQIKRCSAPCVGMVTEAQYADFVSQAKQFLRGRGSAIHDRLRAEMEEASERMDYERAAQLRDRLRALSQVQQQAKSAGGLVDADVLALARAGDAIAVQVSRYRSGNHYGGRAWFPASTEGHDDAEVMAAFIGQFYQRQTPPAQLVASLEPLDCKVLEDALSLLAKRRVEIVVPQRGDKVAVVQQALRNAQDALERHLAESGRQAGLREKVAELFELDAAPERIEVYDNSHVSGTHAVGAMIVAGAEGFDKKAYRIFNIKEAMAPGDDYAMLREVLSRRFRNWSESDAAKPSLLLIDGGAGQLSTAIDTLTQLGINGIPLAAISKGPDRNAGREWFHVPGREPFQLPQNDAVLHYLQRLRDEAHRFAIGAHRNRRSKAAQTSELDSIPSIGPSRKRALLRHFGSARDVGAASVEEIAKVEGVSLALAQKIYNHYHAE